MSPDRWQRIKTLFDAVVDLAPAERAALLTERCSDAELRAEVEKLLTYEPICTFLDRPVFDVLPGRSLSAGQVLADRFRIVRLAGRGGMGEVYEAHDTRLNRRVALKFLPDDLAYDRKALDRFEREARAIAALNHPHICTVYDTGSHDQWPFIVMEFVEGETLEHRLKKGALPLDQALKYAIEIAGALDQAHRHGVIHRDLKPANVMLTKAGAKVLDFGLAKIRIKEVAAGGSHSTSEVTQEGVILGTPAIHGARAVGRQT
jgi:eukaryotic-like serine/threonine-protein kinase